MKNNNTANNKQDAYFTLNTNKQDACFTLNTKQPSDSGFDFSLWVQISKARSEARESFRREILKKVWDVLNTLSEEYSWDELYIFGSIIREGKFSQYSDIDIAISGLNKFLHFKFIGDISMMLDRDVDVILLEECPFAETVTSRGMKWIKEKSFSF